MSASESPVSLARRTLEYNTRNHEASIVVVGDEAKREVLNLALVKRVPQDLATLLFSEEGDRYIFGKWACGEEKMSQYQGALGNITEEIGQYVDWEAWFWKELCGMTDVYCVFSSLNQKFILVSGKISEPSIHGCKFTPNDPGTPDGVVNWFRILHKTDFMFTLIQQSIN
jgi:hypothetical protein